MKIISIEEQQEIEKLVSMETGLIAKGFSLSTDMGLLFFLNAIRSFEENYIKPVYGDIILGMCTEYRVFLVGLLMQVPEQYKDIVFGHLLSSKRARVSDEDLFGIFKEVDNHG